MPTSGILNATRQALRECHSSGWVVGGAIRDALLGRTCADIDLAVDIDREDLPKLARVIANATGSTAVTLDAKRGVYRIVSKSAVPLDVTATPSGIGPDLLQRDFTINALGLPLQLWPNVERSQVLDPTGGLEDLAAKRVRAISEETLAVDPLRLLRAVRLCAELGFEMDSETGVWIKRNATLVKLAAGERIREELVRLIRQPGSERHLHLLDQLGLLTQIIPELEEARGVDQPDGHHWDVLQHSIETVGTAQGILRQESLPNEVLACIPWDEDLASHFNEPTSHGRTRGDILALGALLHDIAKPVCKTVGEDGRIRFLSHAKFGMAPSKRVLERLRFSARETRMVTTMVREHLRPALITRTPEGPSSRALFRYFRDTSEVTVDTLVLSLADYLAAKGPRLDQEDWHAYAERIHGILDTYRSESSEVQVPNLVNGHDLMGTLGLKPGPVVGQLMNSLREAQAAGKIKTRSEALALASKLFASAPTARVSKALAEE